MSETKSALIEQPAPGILRVVLNKPEKRNAFDPTMRAEAMAAFQLAARDSAVRAIILTGAGHVFSAGGDVSSMGKSNEVTGDARMAGNHEFCRLVYRCEKPVIAAVEGPCVGAGVGLALLCDTIIAGEGARFGFPFVKLGLAPDYGIAFTLPQRCGIGIAKSLVFTGRIIQAAEALEIGLADRVVPDAAVQEAALLLAQDMALQSAHAIALSKRMFQNLPQSFDAALDLERTCQTLAMVSADHQEGVAAFMEKRAANFGG
ncbi:MAG: enoyl-CoA hydratase/isomerase family protein [Alphaproteobacteria bacterium]|nr:enoyl-CoA hydratase/isomerase family protein [Alphaproteobacteria bacterium]